MDAFGRIHVKTLADQALERIEAAIMRGELPPGSRVSDLALARTLGISRGPVREAIQRLEGRKLVRRVPHVGTTVVAPSWDDLIEIFTIREALEGMASRLAAEHMTPREVADLEALLEQHQRSEDLRSGAAYYQAAGDLDFHYRIARGSKNRRLVSLLCDELYHVLRIFRLRVAATPGRPLQAFQEHEQILAALRERDRDGAERLMRVHIARTRAILENRSRGVEVDRGAPVADGAGGERG